VHTRGGRPNDVLEGVLAGARRANDPVRTRPRRTRYRSNGRCVNGRRGKGGAGAAAVLTAIGCTDGTRDGRGSSGTPTDGKRCGWGASNLWAAKQ
jgi:hypothetical protein